MKNALVSMINKKCGRVMFKCKKYSPEIFLFAGIGGMVVSAVMACKATTKLSDVLDDADYQLEKIHDSAENPDMEDQYSKEDAKKDTAIVYVQTGVKVVRLYAPSVMVGMLSIASIFASHNEMKKRNVALAAAYSMLSQNFKDYRSRVVDRFGEEVDKQLKYNVISEEFEETKTDAKGKEKKVKQTINVAHPGTSDYAIAIQRGDPIWEKNPEYMKMIIGQLELLSNDRFNAKGYYTLNEAYTTLCKRVTDEQKKAGLVVGWLKNSPDPNADGKIKYEVKEICVGNEYGGHDIAYIVDFNVDGSIYNVM